MKALVLAGGTGTRLRPFTHATAKQLIPVANEPVLVHVLGRVRELGVTEVGVVVGDRLAQIAEAIGDGARLGLRVTYIDQPEPLGLAHAVALARGFLGDDDFVLWLGDNVLPDGVPEIAEEFRARRPAAQLVVGKVPDPRAFGVAVLDVDGRVLRLVEKPRRPPSDLAVIGVYFFTAAVHEAVAAIAPSARGELEITDALQWLIDRGGLVRAREYGGFWKDVGRPADVLECNRRLLCALVTEVAGDVDGASVLTGGVVVGPGARVVRSTIEGPVIIGAGAVVRDSRVGPNVSVGRGCVLAGTRVADSVVMDGASVTATAGLTGSLVGRGAVVAAAGGPGGHVLIAGDDARIELAE